MSNLLRLDPIARRLGTEPARRRVEELLQAEDAASRIRALDPLYLFGLMREAGAETALPLLEHTSGEQAQAIIDFDCWASDRLDLTRLEGWLAGYLQGPYEHMAELQRELDPEVLGLLVRHKLSVYFYEDEEDAELIDRIEGPVESSPDGVYALVMPEDPAEAVLLRELLRRLYAADQDAARQLLHHARWDLVSELEETAYQMRSGRLEGHGFLPLDEAMAIHARISPAREKAAAEASLREGEAEDLALRWEGEGAVAVPVAVAEDLMRLTDDAQGSFAGRALRRAADRAPDLERADGLLRQLTTLTHCALVTDRGRPGDPADTRAALRRVHDMLNVGLEYLTGRDLEKAERLVVSWPLKRIFRNGFNLLATVAAQAQALVEGGQLSLIEELPYGLCSAAEVTLLEGLLELGPLSDREGGRDFASLAEIEAAARDLALLAFKVSWSFEGSDRARDELAEMLGGEGAAVPVEEVSFDSLLATRAAHSVLGTADSRALLSWEAVARIVDEHLCDERLSPPLASALATVATTPQFEVGVARSLAERWAAQVGEKLLEAYGGLAGRLPDDPRFLPSLLLWRAPT